MDVGVHLLDGQRDGRDLLHELRADERRDLVPTGKAETLLDFLAAIGAEVLTKPALTGEWEFKLNRIEKGALTREEFMRETTDAKLAERANCLRNHGASVSEEQRHAGPAHPDREVRHRCREAFFKARLLERDAAELSALHHDLLIGVTTFFRDDAAFRLLAETHGQAVADVDDPSGRVQLFANIGVLGDEGMAAFEGLSVGDIVGAEGEVVMTRRGELSVKVTSTVILAPCQRSMPGLMNFSGRLARFWLPRLPRWVVYNRFNTWGRQRELPPVPQERTWPKAVESWRGP